MKKNLIPPENTAELRRRAEERLKKKRSNRGAEEEGQRTAEETQRLFQELQIHQIELEMQSAELQASHAEVEAGLALYTDLYDFAPVGYFTLGRDGIIRRVNITGARLLEKERSKLVNRRFGLFVSEADRPVFNAFLEKVFASRAKETCEAALRKEEKSARSPELSGSWYFGETRQLTVHIEAIASEDGQECHVVMADITEHKRAEEALRESENKFVTAFTNSPVSITITSTIDGKYVDVNNIFLRDTGYTRDEIIGHTSEELQLFADFNDHERLIYEVRKQGFVYGVEMCLRMKSGEIRFCLISTSIIHIGGQPYFISSIMDITERKRAEEALHQSEEKYRTIIENMEEGYIEVDLTGRLTFFNEAAREFLGYSKDETMGMHYKKYADEENAQKIFKVYNDVYKIRIPQRLFEWEVIRKDGARRTVEGSAYLIKDAEGRPVGFRGLFRDTTERKRSEEEVRKYAAELIEKNEELRAMTQQLWQAAKLATMGELSASIAHELNNPLAVVSLRIESLRERMVADNHDRRDLEIIAQEVERMGNLVANLLQFSRRSRPQISTVDLCEEIEKTLELIHYHLCKHNTSIMRQFVSDVPRIHADRKQLRQLFLNLFTNASDAMPRGGTLTIRVTAPPESMQVIIEVADTGTGIPPEILPKVAEPFFSTKPEGEGTGLGLAICRRIVQEHNGTFDLTSEGIPGKGTTARISLPVNNGTNSASLKNQ